MITKEDTIAIVGASNNSSKYGNIVMKDLLSKGFDVIPINPHEEKILEQQVYHSLKEVPEKVDVVIFIVPPVVVLKVLETVKNLGIQKVWMQPGSESKEAIDFCSKNGIECLHDACIMTQESIKSPQHL